MKSQSSGLHFTTLEKNPRVLAYDNEGTDAGYFMVTLVKGYAFDDAAANVGDDPDARMALHSKTFPSVRDAIDRIKWADRCKCGRCVGLR